MLGASLLQIWSWSRAPASFRPQFEAKKYKRRYACLRPAGRSSGPIMQITDLTRMPGPRTASSTEKWGASRRVRAEIHPNPPAATTWMSPVSPCALSYSPSQAGNLRVGQLGEVSAAACGTHMRSSFLQLAHQAGTTAVSPPLTHVPTPAHLPPRSAPQLQLYPRALVEGGADHQQPASRPDLVTVARALLRQHEGVRIGVG